MEGRVVDRRTGFLWVVVSAAALTVHAGCTNLSGFPDASRGDAGAKDGKFDIKPTSLDGARGKETGSVPLDGAAGGKGGSATGGSFGGAAGTGGGLGGSLGTGGGTTSPTDAALDAPQAGGSGGGGVSVTTGGVVTIGGIVTTGGVVTIGGIVSTGGIVTTGGVVATGGKGGAGGSAAGTGGTALDAGFDLPADRPVDAPGSCSPGYHGCGNTCVVNGSIDPNSCGNNCRVCQAPANGSVTCNGTTCVSSCPAGRHACGNTCVSNGSTDPNSCGNSCTICQAPTGGSVTCNGTSCVQSCPAESHLCNGECISNKSTSGCGPASCTACRIPSNGQATCDGTSCGFSCNSNAHKCGNNCFQNTDATHCGDSCQTCASDAHGSPACQSGSCAVACNTGYHWCANLGVCVVNNSTWPGSCGNSCAVCPLPPTGANATRTCDGAGGCDLKYSSCQAGLTLCGTDCVVPDFKHCGPSCTDCSTKPAPAGPGYVGFCNDDGTCAWKCDSGYNTCPSGDPLKPNCVDLASDKPASCGGSCTSCPTDPNGDQTCKNKTCGFTCKTNYHVCGTGGDISCQLDTDINNCGVGSACHACDAPDGNLVSCVKGACTSTCDTANGYRSCGTGATATCEKNDDAHCGSDCAICTSNQTCNETSCEDLPTTGTQSSVR
jgi:hypothetical protein